MMLPLKIDLSGWSNWLVMNDWTPRSSVVSSCSHAISS